MNRQHRRHAANCHFRELLDAEGRRRGLGRARRPATAQSDHLAATDIDYKTPKAHNPAAK